MAKIISPASGRVLFVKRKPNYVHIAVFLNIYDNHTQYSPVEGIILKQIYFPGNFYPAYLDIGTKNEQLITFIGSEYGLFVVKQIAGTLFKRIVSNIDQGQIVKQSEPIGKIKLGSRVDLYIPNDFNIITNLKKGDQVEAGESVIALLS